MRYGYTMSETKLIFQKMAFSFKYENNLLLTILFSFFGKHGNNNVKRQFVKSSPFCVVNIEIILAFLRLRVTQKVL